jgi:hypothetical protein
VHGEKNELSTSSRMRNSLRKVSTNYSTGASTVWDGLSKTGRFIGQSLGASVSTPGLLCLKSDALGEHDYRS